MPIEEMRIKEVKEVKEVKGVKDDTIDND